MQYPEDTEWEEYADTTEDQHLILDGTANLDYSDDDVPRVKGLIELLKEYFGAKNIWVSNQVEAATPKADAQIVLISGGSRPKAAARHSNNSYRDNCSLK